jgi:hypothetical protein
MEGEEKLRHPPRHIDLTHAEGTFVPFLVNEPVACPALSPHEQERYVALIAATSEELGPRGSDSRSPRSAREWRRSLGPEDDGIMAQVVSTTVPCRVPYTKEADVNYEESVYANGKKERRKFTRRETLALHYGVCCMCKGNLYGFHYECLSCSSEFLCQPCHRSFRQSPEHEQGRVHEHSNFQGYPSDEPVGSARLVLYRKYSAIVSMPHDNLALVWAPAFPHADGQCGKLSGRLLNLTWDGIGIASGIALTTSPTSVCGSCPNFACRCRAATMRTPRSFRHSLLWRHCGSRWRFLCYCDPAVRPTCVAARVCRAHCITLLSDPTPWRAPNCCTCATSGAKRSCGNASAATGARRCRSMRRAATSTCASWLESVRAGTTLWCLT